MSYLVVASGITASSGKSREKIRCDAQLPKENNLPSLVSHEPGCVRGEPGTEADTATHIVPSAVTAAYTDHFHVLPWLL